MTNESNFADRARASNNAAVQAWTEQCKIAEEENWMEALTAPISNKERCSNLIVQNEFSGGFQRSIVVAFFNRYGQFTRIAKSNACTYAGDLLAAVIPRKGEHYARVAFTIYGNGARRIS